MSRYHGNDRRDNRYGSGGGGDRYGARRGGRGSYDRRGDSGPGGGAAHLARIHGTEEDRVNCPFYYKIGACRHGDRCSRMHNKPLFSQTLLIHHLYQNPLAKVIAENGNPKSMDQKRLTEEFEDFYEEMFEELSTYGKVEQMNVCDNLGEHLLGNIYVKFSDEEETAAAHKALYGRFYAGKPIICEYSPVTDFREARCRQFDDGTCTRGGYCNFMHIRTIPRALHDEFEALYTLKKKTTSDSGSSGEEDRSRSPDRRRRRRSRSRSRSHRRSSK